MRQLRSWIITVFVACLMLSSMTATKVSAATGTPVITVASETYTSLRVSWEPVFAAKGYVVFRSTSSTGTYTQVADVVDTNHYIDPGLTFNKIYYYKVQAYALVDGVKVLGSASAIKYAKTALSQVTGQSAVSTAYNNNRISWPAVAGATGYQIYYSTGTSTSFVFLKSLTSTSFNHSGITTARTIDFDVPDLAVRDGFVGISSSGG